MTFTNQFIRNLLTLIFEMAQITRQDTLALRKFGINVVESQKQQLLKLIKSNPVYKEEFQHIKKNLKTIIDQGDFLDSIVSSHQKIAQISQNSKVIIMRDHTFIIRAINPQQIQSLTERAFFNSFNLQRVVLNDLDQENILKNKTDKQQKPVIHKNVPHEVQQYQKANCICGKIKQKQKQTAWIQCANQNKCRGSSWYHIECSGVVNPNLEQLQNLNYICEYCKRNEEQSGSLDPSKRVKKN